MVNDSKKTGTFSNLTRPLRKTVSRRKNDCNSKKTGAFNSDAKLKANMSFDGRNRTQRKYVLSTAIQANLGETACLPTEIKNSKETDALNRHTSEA